jgi:RNA polymerase sigma-70 factor (ECF subfamily)
VRGFLGVSDLHDPNLPRHIGAAALKAFLHLKEFEGRSSFASWLTRIAINSALMNRRKKRSSVISIDNIDGDVGTSETFELPDRREDPERCYARAEREELLTSAIHRLRPILREVIELQLSYEFSIKELAQILGISMPAAKSRLLRAKRTLRASLQSDSNNLCGSASGHAQTGSQFAHVQ